MEFKAVVEIVETEYMQSSRNTKIVYHTIDADTEDEAGEKIRKHYEDKSCNYGTSYSVYDVDFFEHIK